MTKKAKPATSTPAVSATEVVSAAKTAPSPTTALEAPATRPIRRGGLRRNLRPVFLLLLIPMIIGATTAVAIAGGLYRHNLADFGNRRLATVGWEQAADAMKQAQPDYVRKFAYYKVKEGQTVASVAASFGVSQTTLAGLNPGTFAVGTTIKVPPIENPLAPAASNGKLRLATVTLDNGIIRVAQKFGLRQPIVTTIPELMPFLAKYGAIQQVGPTSFRLNKAISLDGDIRLDITSATVTRLELTSTPTNITCLCFDQSAVLMKDVTVVSYDPATGQPDPNYADGRSFVRMKNGRMDILNSNFSYLGNALTEAAEDSASDTNNYLKEGGIYGVSWRISKGTLGANITTGWVQGSSFQHNHFGTFTFGASGMMWRSNYFAYNDVYGLDPHDDSNNAMIEDNIFEHNGKHGFIVSKRCNYNVIRNNISLDNKLHGFMLHKDSAYNVIENNVAYGNQDNYVVFESNYNTIRNNISYAPRSAGIRINMLTNNTYLTSNTIVGGKRGIFLYDGVKNVLVQDNRIHQVSKTLKTDGTNNILLTGNTIDGLFYDIDSKDTNGMIYGLNTVKPNKDPIPSLKQVRQEFLRNNQTAPQTFPFTAAIHANDK